MPRHQRTSQTQCHKHRFLPVASCSLPQPTKSHSCLLLPWKSTYLWHQLSLTIFLPRTADQNRHSLDIWPQRALSLNNETQTSEKTMIYSRHFVLGLREIRREHLNPKKIAMQSYQFSLRNLVRFVLNREKGITYCQYVSGRSPNCGAPFLFANIIGRKGTPLSCACDPCHFETQHQFSCLPMVKFWLYKKVISQTLLSCVLLLFVVTLSYSDKRLEQYVREKNYR